MFKKENFNEWFFPLEIGLHLKDGKYYLIDYPNNNAVKLKNDGKILDGVITRGDERLHFQIGNRFVSLDNNHDQVMRIDDNGFCYTKKNSDNAYNQHFVEVSPNSMSFYDYETINDNGYCIRGLKTYRDFQYLKINQTIKNDGLLKDDFIYQMENGKAVSYKNSRQYSISGCLVSSNSEQEKIEGNLPTLILQKTVTNDCVRGLLDTMNKMIPGICDSLSKNSSMFNIVYRLILEQQKTNH